MTKTNRVQALINHFGHGKPGDFAKLLGVAASTISSWKARDTFDLELVFAKCEGVSPAWLLTGEGEMLTDKHSGISQELIETDPTIGKNYIPPTSPTDIQPPTPSPQDNSIITSLVTTIQTQAEEIGRLRERIAQLEREKNDARESF